MVVETPVSPELRNKILYIYIYNKKMFLKIKRAKLKHRKHHQNSYLMSYTINQSMRTESM